MKIQRHNLVEDAVQNNQPRDSLHTDAGKKILNDLKELAEKLGGELKQSSDKVTSFYFGEKTKPLKQFQTAAKYLFNKAAESVTPKNDEGKAEISQDKNGTADKRKEENPKGDQNNATNYLSPKDKVKQKLLQLAGKSITNKATGMVAFIEELYGNGAEKKECKAFLIMGLSASGKSTIADSVAKENGALIEVNLYHVALLLTKTLERTQNRFKETGRLVSSTYIKSVCIQP